MRAPAFQIASILGNHTLTSEQNMMGKSPSKALPLQVALRAPDPPHTRQKYEHESGPNYGEDCAKTTRALTFLAHRPATGVSRARECPRQCPRKRGSPRKCLMGSTMALGCGVSKKCSKMTFWTLRAWGPKGSEDTGRYFLGHPRFRRHSQGRSPGTRARRA